MINKQGGAIGVLNQKIQNVTKGINIIFTTMDGMVQNFHSMVKEMEYYEDKLHQVDKRVEVSNTFFLWKFLLTDKYYMFPFGSIRLL